MSTAASRAGAAPQTLDPEPTASAGEAPAYLRPMIGFDAAGSAVVGIVMATSPAWIATGLGLATDRPIRMLGAMLLLNAVVNGRAARRTSWARTMPCVAIDLVFAGAMLGLLIADPWDSTGWSQWGIAGLGLFSLDVGLLKLLGLRRMAG